MKEEYFTLKESLRALKMSLSIQLSPIHLTAKKVPPNSDGTTVLKELNTKHSTHTVGRLYPVCQNEIISQLKGDAEVPF